ncbi:MAG: hypothetical protein L6Q71_01505, partial [Planctomycetes bacterium]|nr:hypothetical protein [Planctomycetota bacterium]
MAKKITLNDLGEHEPLMGGIVSMEGVSLYNAGDYVGAQEIDFLRDFKFDPVYLADDEEDHEATIAKLRYLA